MPATPDTEDGYNPLVSIVDDKMGTTNDVPSDKVMTACSDTKLTNELTKFE